MDDQKKGTSGDNVKPSLAATFLENQKNFLHAIASPVSVSQGMIDIVISHLKDHADENKGDIDKLEKAARAIEKLASLIDQNRMFLTSDNTGEIAK